MNGGPWLSRRLAAHRHSSPWEGNRHRSPLRASRLYYLRQQAPVREFETRCSRAMWGHGIRGIIAKNRALQHGLVAAVDSVSQGDRRDTEVPADHQRARPDRVVLQAGPLTILKAGTLRDGSRFPRLDCEDERWRWYAISTSQTDLKEGGLRSRAVTFLLSAMVSSCACARRKN